MNASTSAVTPVLPATLRLGPVAITVADLGRSVEWYERALGLRVHEHDVTSAQLGDGETVTLELTENAQARPAGRHSGLYHYALLYPSRAELARAAVRLAQSRTPIQGASDHGTHEAIYLPDPDGNGIELAADRPRDQWGGGVAAELYRGGPAPLDTDALLAVVTGEAPAERVEAGLRVGHMHLHIGDLEQALAFYRDVLGFEVQATMPTAAFVSAGGYHHHLGLNTWKGQGAPPQPEGVVGLRHWTIALDTAEQVAEVRARVEAAGGPVEAEDERSFVARDPWNLAVRVSA